MLTVAFSERLSYKSKKCLISSNREVLMILRFTLTALLLFSALACSSRKPFTETPEEKPQEEVAKKIEPQIYQGPLTEADVRVEFEAAEGVGNYTLKVTWPKNIPEMKILVDEKPYAVFNDRFHFEKTVRHSSTTKIRLIARNQNREDVSLLDLTKTAPNDLIVEKGMHLNKDTVFMVNRAYFLDQAPLITEGHDLTIMTNELISLSHPEGSGIEVTPIFANILTTLPGNTVFHEKLVANSTIHIISHKSTGVLRIGMIGFNGEEKNSGGYSLNGGDTGSLYVDGGESSNFRLEVALKPGKPALNGYPGKINDPRTTVRNMTVTILK